MNIPDRVRRRHRHPPRHSRPVVVTVVEATVASAEVAANADGCRRLLVFARHHLPDRRCWAVEESSSYGAGLTE